MRDSKSSGKKPIDEVQTPRARKPKLESLRPEAAERKKAEETLRQSEERFRTFTENAPDFIFQLDRKGMILFTNRTYEDVSVEQVVGTSIFAWLEEEYRPVFRTALAHVFETAESKVIEYMALGLEGETCWYSGHIGPVKTKVRTGSVIMIAHDITERKQAEEALQESQIRYRTLFESTPMGIAVATKEGRLLEFNDPILQMTGYSDTEIRQINTRDLYQNPEKRVLILKQLEANGFVQDFEVQMKRKDGTPFYASLTVTPFTLCGKDVLLTAVKDITERKRVEETLRESEERYRAIFEQAADSIVLIDAETGTLVEFNNKAHENLGYTREEFQKLKIPGFEVIESSEEVDKHIKKIVKERADTFETKQRTKNGQIRDILVSSRAISIGGRAFVQSIWRDITESKRAEDALQESEEKYREIVELAPDGIVTVDLMGIITSCNTALMEQTGYCEEDFVDRHISKIPSARLRDMPKYLKMFSSLLRGKVPKPFEFIWIHKNGTEHWGEVRVSVLKRKGRTVGFQAITRDITERKRAEEALRDSEEKFRLIFENAMDAILWADTETGSIIHCNRAAEVLLESKRSEMIGKHQTTIHPPQKAKYYAKMFKRHIEQKAAFDNEIEVITKSGKIKTAHITATVTLVKGKPIIQGIFRDVTGYKRAQEALRERERLLELFFSQSLDGFFFMMLDEPVRWDDTVDKEKVMDYVFSNQRITKVNDAMLEQYGATREQFIGTTPNDLYTHDIAYGRDVWKRFFDAGRLHVETDERKLDGTPMWIEGDYICLYDSKGRITGHFGIQRDITERKKAEGQLLDYQAQLRSLASELSLAEEHERRRIATELHDQISQSLVVSKIKMETLRESASSAEFGKELNEVCNSLGQTIAETRSLMFDIHSPLLALLGFEEAVAEWLTKQIEEKHGIATEFEDDGQPKSLDDDIQVLLFRDVKELLNNIVMHAHAKKIKVSIRKVGSQISVSVEDNGVGFDSTQVWSMVTKKEAFGLFSIRERLEELGGRLKIESKPGHGTVVTITAPLKAKKNAKGR